MVLILDKSMNCSCTEDLPNIVIGLIVKIFH